MIPFEYYAPPGDSEVEVYGPGLVVTSAVVRVDGPLTIEGVQCLPFQTTEQEGVKKTSVMETRLPSLPAKIKVTNPAGTLVYLRILMEMHKESPSAASTATKSSKSKAEPKTE